MKHYKHFRVLRTALAVVALAPLAALAQGGPPRGDDDRDQRGPQPQQQHGQPPHGQPQRGPSQQRDGHGDNRPGPQQNARGDQDRHDYDFRQQDRAQLQQHYRRSLQKIDRDRRPQFAPGREIPRAYRGYVTPAPVAVRRNLPPPPAGYTIGYYQGYTVVYDPTTFVILSVLDLLSQ